MLKSQQEIVAQGMSYLQSVSHSNYTAILAPHFISSAGSHFRHIIDHYLAIIFGIENNLIDYDIRHRGGEIEVSPELAIEKLDYIALWLGKLTPIMLNKTIELSTEISVTDKKTLILQTSVARELVFAGSHAVHHYALIAQIALMQNASIPPSFGIAPATATFLRPHNLQ
jgi:hypothetical protein